VPPGAVWIHAVSLGETRAAEPLIAALRELRPGLRLLLTHGTATGREAGLPLLRLGDAQRWLPFDLPGATARFLRRHRPAVGVLMETEVWPQLQAAALRAGVPMVLANARLSDKSLRQSLRFDALLRPAAASMTRVLAQTDADAARLRLAGAGEGAGLCAGSGPPAGDFVAVQTPVLTSAGVVASASASTTALATATAVALTSGAEPRACRQVSSVVSVVGNLKFDLIPEPALLDLGRRWRTAVAPGRPVLLAASWREGEDEPLLAAWAARLRLHAQAQDASSAPLLVLVPRHPQRFDLVASLVESAGLTLSRRSSWTGSGARAAAHPAEGADAVQSACTSTVAGAMSDAQPPASAASVDVWLGDSMREMPAWYALADAALLGGSYARLGGQNLIEAAACGCPVLMGPHTFNFATAAELAVEAGAAQRADDLDQALTLAHELFVDADALARRRAAALSFAAAHQGAARRIAVAVLDCLPS
jgi:3-deoxy-D-manno-octulosonic-acid transferase